VIQGFVRTQRGAVAEERGVAQAAEEPRAALPEEPRAALVEEPRVAAGEPAELDEEPELPVIQPTLVLTPEEIEIVNRDAQEIRERPIVVHFDSLYHPGRVLEDNFNFS
jgi:hypothetical protein